MICSLVILLAVLATISKASAESFYKFADEYCQLLDLSLPPSGASAARINAYHSKNLASDRYGALVRLVNSSVARSFVDTMNGAAPYTGT